ncbi:MAG: tRNA 2-thiocytidine biosynthesis protein TtcA [Treponema sp.]|nr:tRNA 2-thiocytidine biosynthesis protein TtcA [Treponema sp.]
MPEPKIFRIIDKIVFDYSLIEDGDKILIGASGGKDSTVLIEYFAKRKKQNRDNFEFLALYVESGLGEVFNEELKAMIESWDVKIQTVNANVITRLKPNKKMNCWWCTTQRRTELKNYAVKNGFNKIALGHHLDDVLETLLMNALQKGELSTMTPKFKYEKYPVTIIRPLSLVDEKTIIAHAKENGYKNMTCTCTYQNNSSRKEARCRLQNLTDDNYKQKRRLFDALKNIKTEYLP